MTDQQARRLQKALLPWYERVKRDLPWRRTRDPYAIWLSEIMLQQTRVETVIPYFTRFVAALTTVQALAEAPSDRVMSLWSGLGYYRRARMLHEGAKQLATESAGFLPSTVEGLANIRGIGRYTAGAIASIAFGARAALVDGNVARVLARLFAVEEDVRTGSGLRRVWQLADALVPQGRAGEWNQAVMELGATVCTPRTPACLGCPARRLCAAHAAGREAELPRLAPKAPPRAARQVCLVVTANGRVLLARRRPGALFGGLWEPPAVSDPTTRKDAALTEGSRSFARNLPGIQKAFSALLGWDIESLTGLTEHGEVTHVLTHQRLVSRVVSIRLARAPRLQLAVGAYDQLRMVSPSRMGDLGMSTLARKVLGRAGALALAAGGAWRW